MQLLSSTIEPLDGSFSHVTRSMNYIATNKSLQFSGIYENGSLFSDITLIWTNTHFKKCHYNKKLAANVERLKYLYISIVAF